MTSRPWSRAFDTHIPAIDRRRRELDAQLSALDASIQSGQGRIAVEPALDGLATFAHRHFGDEEHLMERCAYPGADAHRAEHVAFVKRLVDYRSAHVSGQVGVSADVASFLAEWISAHVCGTDHEFFGYLAAIAAQGHPAAQSIDLLAVAS